MLCTNVLSKWRFIPNVLIESSSAVLPRFDVKLAPPKYVRPGDANIDFTVIAK